MLQTIGLITVIGLGLWTGIIQMLIAMFGMALIWVGSLLTLAA